MKIYRNLSLCLLIAIVLFCGRFVRSGTTPIGVSETDDSSYMWCDDIDGESGMSDAGADNDVNKNSLAYAQSEPAPGNYELVGVLS